MPATSAGIAPAAELQPGALDVAARRGIDLSGAYPKPLGEISQDDLVISVCDRAHDALTERGGLRELHWSVPDPAAREAVITFDQAADVLTDRITSLGLSVSPL